MGKLEASGNSWSLCTLGLPEDPLGYPVSKVERTMVLSQLFPSRPCITMLLVKSVWLLVLSCLLKSISICWLNLVDSSLLLLIDVVWYLLLSRFQLPYLFDSTSLLEFRCKFPKVCCLHLSSGSKSMVSPNLGACRECWWKSSGRCPSIPSALCASATEARSVYNSNELPSGCD